MPPQGDIAVEMAAIADDTILRADGCQHAYTPHATPQCRRVSFSSFRHYALDTTAAATAIIAAILRYAFCHFHHYEIYARHIDMKVIGSRHDAAIAYATLRHDTLRAPATCCHARLHCQV